MQPAITCNVAMDVHPLTGATVQHIDSLYVWS